MKNKKKNQETETISNGDEDTVNFKDDKKDLIDLDWIFDKGWLRTKK